MSRVMYGGKRLIPAPFVSINKTYQKANNGDIIGRLYDLTVTGTIVAHMGSPKTDGTFHDTGGYPAAETVSSDERLGAIFRKQEAIRDLFSTEGLSFEIQSADGSNPLRCYPRIVSIEFPENLWYERCEYTIVLNADFVDGLHDESGPNDIFTEYLESVDETWGIDTNEDPQALGAPVTYGLSHTVSAVGKKHYDETGTVVLEPWQQAEKYVLGRLGFDSVMALSSGVNNLPSYYNGWNHRRSSQVDKKGGGYSVTESWLLASGNATEDFSINMTTTLEVPHDRVSIQGQVTGFEERNSDMDILTTKWDNAKDQFTWASGIAYTRAQTYTGKTLNIEPLNLTVGRNPLQGTIDYSIDYDTRPMKLIEGAKSEDISISDNVGGDLFATIFVLGRTAGPVLQDLNTKSANTRNLSVEIVVDPPSYSDRTVSTMADLLINQNPMNHVDFSGNLNNLVTAADPSRQGFSTVFQDQPQENWDFINGRYSYNTTWTYE